MKLKMSKLKSEEVEMKKKVGYCCLLVNDF